MGSAASLFLPPTILPVFLQALFPSQLLQRWVSYQKNYVHRLPLTQGGSDLDVEEYQISGTGLSLCKPMATVPDGGIAP